MPIQAPSLESPVTVSVACAFVSAVTAPLGAVLGILDDVYERPPAELALAGATGGVAIGAARCLLDLALPPPNETALGARHFVFGIGTIVGAPFLGAWILSRSGQAPPMDVGLAGTLGVLGTCVAGGAVGAAALSLILLRVMLVGDI